MKTLAVALGLVLALEGALYALAPGTMKAMMRKVQDVPEQSLRTGGLVAVVLGAFVVWLIRG